MITKAEFERRAEAGVDARLRANHDAGQAHRADERNNGAAARALRLIARSMVYEARGQHYWADPRAWQISMDRQAVDLIEAALKEAKA